LTLGAENGDTVTGMFKIVLPMNLSLPVAPS
jgi:hypothetical protein